jgi:deoxyribonuclease IV
VPEIPLVGAHRPIGAHARFTGSLRYAAAVGAEAIQVFVSNPRGWARPPSDARQDALRDHVAASSCSRSKLLEQG